MDPNFPFGRKLEQGESSCVNENANESDARIRFRRRRLQEEAERVGLNNRFNGRLVHWSLPPHPSNNIRPTRVRPERQTSDDNSAPVPPSHLDAWLARHRAKSQDDLPVHVMTGFRGTVVGNRIRRMQKTETSPTVGVDPCEDYRNYPQLNYDLSFFDRRGRRRFVTPKEQYDANGDFVFMLDWNQTPYSRDAAALLEWPNLFVERNKLEAKCRQYMQKVPKARSVQMMNGRRLQCLHNDVCERLQVEIKAMTKRVTR